LGYHGRITGFFVHASLRKDAKTFDHYGSKVRATNKKSDWQGIKIDDGFKA